MRNIAIICEYNPFHNGHARQIEALRAEYSDAGIVCIMSGNYTQRAEPAVAPKFDRARAAVLGGADLVLELPFPYSSASAEYFASAGVHIANSLGCIDMLSFGSECGDIDKIISAAKNLNSAEFISALEKRASENKGTSYAVLREELYRGMYGDADILSYPNNILAIEYVKAIYANKSKITPITITREGDGYNETGRTGAFCPSASAVRELIKAEKIEEIELCMPHMVFELYRNILNEKKCPSDISKLEYAILSYLRLCDPLKFEDIAEGTGGLANRVYDAAREAKSLDELFALCATKKYTNARIRRVVFNSLVSVRESDIKKMPQYTQLLAANSKGREILKIANKNFNILVKPAEYKKFDDETRAQIELSHRADAIYPLMLPCLGTAHEYISATPHIIE